MKLKILIGVAIAAVFGWQAAAQNYDTNGDFVQTFAGSGFSGYVDGVGQLTMFNNPNSIVADSHGNLFAWDSGNLRIRELAPDGTVTTFAGTNGNLEIQCEAMTIDHNNTIWMLTYSSDSQLYEITSNATVRWTFTGLWVESPAGLCVDSQNNIYIAAQQRIYRYTNGVLTVLAGSGNGGYADGNGIFTAFNGPAALACDEADDIYVWDSGNRLIRRIDQSQNVTTFAGKYQNISNMDGVGTNAEVDPKNWATS